jgi:hypothetical protein
MKILALGLLGALTIMGCRGASVRDYSARELERNFEDSDRQVRQSRTLSSLAQLETALESFVQHERRIPERLEELVPKYLAEIPSVDTGIKGHEESATVEYYPTNILEDGLLDGTRLRDRGRWGYVHNDAQVVIFVDCTHPSPRGKPWYQERGQ